jgi:HAMP domain-containing protein
MRYCSPAMSRCAPRFVFRPGAPDPPAFVRRAFETMPYVAAVVIRDATGQKRWTLGNVPPSFSSPGLAEQTDAPGDVPEITARADIVDDGSAARLGDVLVFTRIDVLIPELASQQSTGAQFLAVHDRTDGAWVSPPMLPAASLDDSHFTWEGHHWLVVRRSLDAPAIDLAAAGNLDSFTEPFTHAAAVGSAALAGVATIVIALTLLVSGRLTRSLAHLARGADAVARGDLDARIDVRSTDEVGRVAHTFNTMTDSIRRMMHELSQREAVAAMGELAATLAHQVRSPATAMRLDVQRAHDKLAPDAPERALLARALGQLDRRRETRAGRGEGAHRRVEARECAIKRAWRCVVARATLREPRDKRDPGDGRRRCRRRNGRGVARRAHHYLDSRRRRGYGTRCPRTRG